MLQDPLDVFTLAHELRTCRVYIDYINPDNQFSPKGGNHIGTGSQGCFRIALMSLHLPMNSERQYKLAEFILTKLIHMILSAQTEATTFTPVDGEAAQCLTTCQLAAQSEIRDLRPPSGGGSPQENVAAAQNHQRLVCAVSGVIRLLM